MPQQPPALPRRQCRHCGTPFAPHHQAEHFCCSGCEAVSELIQSQGLNHFYDLRQGISAPVGNRGLEPRDFGWLQILAAQAEADAYTAQTYSADTATTANTTATEPRTAGAAISTAGTEPRTAGTTISTVTVDTEPDTAATAKATGHATAILALPLCGIHCAGCRWLIAQLFSQQPAADTCALDDEGLFIRFSWSLPDNRDSKAPRFDVLNFANLLLAFGYALENPALPRPTSQQNTNTASNSVRKRLAPRLLLCGVFALNAIIFSLPIRLGASVDDFPFLRLFGMLVFLCATLATGLAVSYFWQVPAQSARGNAADRVHRAKTDATAQGSGQTVMNNNAAAFGARKLVALLLILLCILSFAGASLALPAIFAADSIAATSFAALLIAYVAKR